MTTDARITTDPTSRFGSAAPAAVEDTRVVAALEEYLRIREASHAPNPSEFAARFPGIADTLRQALAGLVFLEGAAPSIESSSAAVGRLTEDGLNTGEPLGDFCLIREIGRGGMGVVYEAQQRSLGRRVAVKILPFAATLDRRQLARFQNEARAAAVLDHPNIVPVYYVGCERGVHHYAMQFIEGRSLAEIIAVLRQEVRDREPEKRGEPVVHSRLSGAENILTTDHGQRTTDQSPSEICDQESEIETVAIAALTTEFTQNPKQYFRRVAELAVQAAEAIEHAHRHGIIHRDVKPANLLLDVTGKLWVTDFGLAHVESKASLTMTGDVLGTLRYMSPEQAAGRSALVDHRTDVYSLGTTLYELAVLRPVFVGYNRAELLRNIATEEAAPLSQARRRVPADFETIIRKAIEKDPQDRYPSAGDLAADLRRFLEDKPITARRPGALARLGRWSRRHRPVVATFLCMAFALLVASTLVFWHGRSEARMQQREAERAREHAEARTQFARQVVDDMYTKVAQNWLDAEGGLTQVQQEFLEKAAAFYEDLASDVQSDPQIRKANATAQLRLAVIRRRLGQADLAEGAFLRSISLFQQLVDEYPKDDQYREAVARAQANAPAMIRPERPRQAENMLRMSAETFSRLHDQRPDEVRYQSRLADSLHNLGTFLVVSGRGGEAVEQIRLSIEHKEALAARFPENIEYQLDLARSSINLGHLVHQLQSPDYLQQAEEAYRRVIRTVEPLAEKESRLPEARQFLAEAHYALAGFVLPPTARLREALDNLSKAVELQAELIGQFPDVPEYTDHLDDFLATLNHLLLTSLAGEESSDLVAEGERIYDVVLHRFPEVPEYRLRFARGLHMLAETVSQNDSAAGEVLYRHAIEVLAHLAESAGDLPVHSSTWGTAAHNLALLLAGRGELAEARQLLEQAITHQEAALASEPANPTYKSFLENHQHALEELLTDHSEAGAPQETVHESVRSPN